MAFENDGNSFAGLTRWQFIFGEVEVESDKEFGDFHSMAIEEAWYKSAILQHQIDKQSFVYSVPHYGEDEQEGSEIKVTASMAIFPRDGNSYSILFSHSDTIRIHFQVEWKLRHVSLAFSFPTNSCTKGSWK